MRTWIRRGCFTLGAGLLLWTSAEFFLLAFLTSRFMEGAGIGLWLQGFVRVLLTSPAGIAGMVLTAAGTLLTVRSGGHAPKKKETGIPS